MSPREPRREDAGFTLLEILISTLITALLITAAITTFRNVTRAQEQAQRDDSRAVAAQVLLDRLERELVGTLLVVKRDEEDRLGHPWVFVGTDRVFDANDSDAIVFVTQNPARAAGLPGLRGVRMVEYVVEPSREEDRLDLYRAESRLPEGMRKRVDAELIPVVEDVHSFRLEYQSEESGLWHEAWDSTDLALVDQLPSAVQLSVSLMERRRDGTIVPGAEYTRTVELPVRPLAPHEEDADAGCPGGMTVAKCFNLIRAELQSLVPPVKQSVLMKRMRVTDQCWNPAQPSAALKDLKQYLPRVLVTDPSSPNVCG